MKKALTSALIALAACATPVAAQTKLDFILNWVPGGDHAPYYYANKMGWYAKEGLYSRHSKELRPGVLLACQTADAINICYIGRLCGKVIKPVTGG